MAKTLSNDLTTGNVPKQLLRFALPFILSNALQILYGLVDMVIVGHFVGSFGLSAVSNISVVMNFCYMFGIGFSTGGQVYIAQLIGGGRREKLNSTIGSLFSILFLIGAVIAALVLSFRNGILSAVNIPPECRDMAMDYLVVCSCGTVLTFGYNMVSAVLRGMGNSRQPFQFIAIASVVNLILDLLFTGLLGWGVAGAAAATVLGQAVSFLFAVRFLYKRKEQFGFDFRPKSFIPDGAIAKVLVSLGLPFAIQSSAVVISMIYVNRLVNGVGVYASAAFGVGCKLDELISKTTQGIMYAVSPMVGQSMAAGKYDRVKKTVYWGTIYSLVVYVLFALAYVLFGRQLFSLFTEDVIVMNMAPTFFSAVVWGFPAMALMRGAGGLVQGVGFSKLSMLLGILDGVVFRITLSYVIGIVMGYGFWGIAFGFSAAAYAYGIPAFVYFLSGRWKKRAVLT